MVLLSLKPKNRPVKNSSLSPPALLVFFGGLHCDWQGSYVWQRPVETTAAMSGHIMLAQEKQHAFVHVGWAAPAHSLQQICPRWLSMQPFKQVKVSAKISQSYKTYSWQLLPEGESKQNLQTKTCITPLKFHQGFESGRRGGCVWILEALSLQWWESS